MAALDQRYRGARDGMTLHSLTDGMNDRQKAAITAGDGPTLVLAGPGSGKTAVLTRRIAWLIRERGLPHHRIIAVTFTNKAAGEMRTRVEALLGAPLRGMQLGTFHRISMRLLRREAARIGYRGHWRIIASNRQYWVIRGILERYAAKDPSFSPTKVRKAISLAKNRMLTPAMFEATDEFTQIVAQVYQTYQAELLDENLMDLDDLLLQLAILLREFSAVRDMFQQEFEYVLVDEFQDTNLVQYEIVKMLAPPQKNIFVVGDEDQSIYGFRGANYRNLVRLRRDFAGLRQYLLEQNYRSTQTILDAARAVIAHNPHRTPKALFSDTGVGHRIQVYEASSDLDEADFVRDKIEELLVSARHRLGDIAIMYRNNVQSFPFRNVLHRHGLSFRVVNAVDFDQRREVKDIMALMHLAYEFEYRDMLKRIADIKAFGISKDGMERFLDWLERDELTLSDALDRVKTGASPLNRRQQKAFVALADMLKAWRQSALIGKLVDLFDRISRQAKIPQHLERICKEDWELDERRTGVNRLRQLAGAASTFPDPFAEFVNMVASEEEDAARNQDRLSLTTLHSAKGMEFPVVFIIGLNEKILPHVHESEGPNDVTEERRLFYVGLTRAESRLYLTYTRNDGPSDELRAPSMFLSELPDYLLEVY